MAKAKRYSKKRAAILEAVTGVDSHPTAEWVYQSLKPTYPDLSLGTVYRNLAQFKDEGRIASAGVVGGQERFDGNVAPHAHFICQSCGAVVDMHGIGPDPGLRGRAEEQYQVAVARYELTFHGTCGQCNQ